MGQDSHLDPPPNGRAEMDSARAREYAIEQFDNQSADDSLSAYIEEFGHEGVLDALETRMGANSMMTYILLELQEKMHEKVGERAAEQHFEDSRRPRGSIHD